MSTRTQWTYHLKTIQREWGTFSVSDVRPKHILALRDKYAATPAQTNNLIRALSSMLNWAVPREWLTANPCLSIRNITLKGGDPYVPWSRDMIEKFARISKPRLWWVAALALYTGQRRGDCLRINWADEKSGVISLRQHKTKKALFIPMHAELRALWKEIPRISPTVLCNARDRPWTSNGFGVEWHKQMREPEFAEFREKRLVFHGLRKSAVVMLLESGCTSAEVGSITGQSLEMIEHYARGVTK